MAASSIPNRDEAQWFRLMAQVSPVIIWVTNADGELIFVNRAGVNFFGISEPRFTSPGVWNAILHPADSQKFINTYLESAKQRKPFRAQARVKRADGTWRWIDSYGAPYFSEEGQFQGLVGSSPDITEQVEQAERLQELDHRKDALLAMLAHELRNPLAPLKEGIGLIRKVGPLPERQQTAFEIIERQCDRLTRLVDDLTDLERIATGKLRVRKAPIEVHLLVDRVRELTRSTVEKQQQRLAVSLPSTKGFVEGDEMRLCQIFSNLINNSSKFSPAGSEITVTVHLSKDQVQIAVKDLGIGIDNKELERIFEMFAQAKHRSARMNTGMGLGLALAKELVQLHDGTIEARSEGHGKGSEFIVRLPPCNAA